MRIFNPIAVALLISCCAYMPGAVAVTLGQTDTFGPGDSNGWAFGGGIGAVPFTASPTAATGGPAGAGDSFLSLSSTGVLGPGGKLTSYNAFQWTGDFTAAGVTRITMDVNNTGATDLHLRLFFGTGDLLNLAGSSSAVAVAAGSGWQNISFDIKAADLFEFAGDAASALAAVAFTRLYNSEDLLPPGNQGLAFPSAPLIVAELGVDNISAVPVPPAIVLFFSAIAGLWARSRKI